MSWPALCSFERIKSAIHRHAVLPRELRGTWTPYRGRDSDEVAADTLFRKSHEYQTKLEELIAREKDVDESFYYWRPVKKKTILVCPVCCQQFIESRQKKKYCSFQCFAEHRK